MKILELLEDDNAFMGGFDSPSTQQAGPDIGPETNTPAPQQKSGLRFSDLSTLQVAMLKKIASGALDIENVSDNTLNVLDELKDLGLVDDAYELTGGGDKAVRIANKVGGSGEQIAARNKNSFDEPSDDDFDTDGLDGEEFDDDYDFDDEGSKLSGFGRKPNDFM